MDAEIVWHNTSFSKRREAPNFLDVFYTELALKRFPAFENDRWKSITSNSVGAKRRTFLGFQSTQSASGCSIFICVIETYLCAYAQVVQKLLRSRRIDQKFSCAAHKKAWCHHKIHRYRGLPSDTGVSLVISGSEKRYIGRYRGSPSDTGVHLAISGSKEI